MGLFQKNGAGVMDVIRCDEKDYLMWKWRPEGNTKRAEQRANSIRWGSSLRVKDGSVAVFVYPQDDMMQDFIEGPFDQIIDTQNFPVLANLVGGLYAGGTPFQAEVYFINLADLQLQFTTPCFDAFDIRASEIGVPVSVSVTINFHIEDYRAFFKKRSMADFDFSEFENLIKSDVVGQIKPLIITASENYKIPLVQIQSRLPEITNALKEDLISQLQGKHYVVVTDIILSEIDIDKESEGFKKLEKRTQNKAAMFIQTVGNLPTTFTLNRIGNKSLVNHKRDKGSEPEEPSSNKLTSAIGSAIGGLKKPPKGTPPPIPGKDYHVIIDGEDQAGLGLDDLAGMIKDGRLSEESLVWKDGMKDWKVAKTMKELKGLFDS